MHNIVDGSINRQKFCTLLQRASPPVQHRVIPVALLPMGRDPYLAVLQTR